MPLNPKQERFVREYLISLNATQAAVKAGYSVATARSQGSRLLAHADIRAALSTGTARVAEKLDLSAERVMGEIAHFAHSDPLGIFCEDGTLKHLADMDPGVRRAIKSLKFTELFDGASGEKFVAGRIVDVQFWDKAKGLEMEGRHLKLFTDKLEVSGKLTLEQLVEQAAKQEH